MDLSNHVHGSAILAPRTEDFHWIGVCVASKPVQHGGEKKISARSGIRIWFHPVDSLVADLSWLSYRCSLN
jgi:hypothetical protein